MVFSDTVEEDVRLELVEELARCVKEAENLRDTKDKGFSAKQEGMIVPQRARKEETREDTGGEIGGGRVTMH